MTNVTYDAVGEVAANELFAFYRSLGHESVSSAADAQRVLDNSAAFIAARCDGRLVGIARGLCDGVRGYLTECKLDPAFQGPAAITRRDGRVEHDHHGIAAEMARRVLTAMSQRGVHRVDVLAWGTEVDFCEELGFKRQGGLVGLTLDVASAASLQAVGSA